MTKEIWKDIFGYEGKYQASTLGRIKTLKDNHGNDREKILKPYKNNNGYLQVYLYKNGNKKSYLVHRLVIESFMGKPLDKDYYSINHLDENKTNNNINNLQYCTHKYNCNYGTRNERATKSITNNIKKAKTVIGINKINGYIVEYQSTREVERCLGINQTSISRCCNGKQKSAGGYRWFYKDVEVEK